MPEQNPALLQVVLCTVVNYTGNSTKCKNENRLLSSACGMAVFKHLGSSWLACFGLDLW